MAEGRATRGAQQRGALRGVRAQAEEGAPDRAAAAAAAAAATSAAISVAATLPRVVAVALDASVVDAT